MKSLIFILLCCTSTYCANILAIFPIPSISHNIVFRTITRELERRGHSLTIITPKPDAENNNPNVTQISLMHTTKTYKEIMNFNEMKERKFDEVDVLDIWLKNSEKLYDEQFNTDKIKELIKSRRNFKFDLVILQYIDQIPWHAFATIFNAPIVGISSLDLTNSAHYYYGNGANVIVYPDYSLPLYGSRNFWDRARIVRYYLWLKLYYLSGDSVYKKIIKKNIGDIDVPFEDLQGIADVVLVNTHPVLGYVRPLTPATVQLGFLHIKDPKPIEDKAVQKYLDDSDRPIIYMSFGSAVKSMDMSENSLNIFKETFAEINFNVMWKWEGDEMEVKPDNIFTLPWFPQADLLTNEKVKVFITQGGQQSMEEAVDRGVPMIVIPFAIDQQTNSQRIEKLGIGISLDLDTLTKEKLKDAIERIVSGNFTRNIHKLRELVKDQPMKPLEKAIWWIEYVIKHQGAKHLEYPGRKVRLWQSLMLDFIGIAIVAVYLALKIFATIFNIFKRKPNIDKKKLSKKEKDKLN